MKILDKIGLILFSTILLIVSFVMCLLLFGWLEVSTIDTLLKNAINDNVASNILLGVCIFIILLAIKCIFFESKSNTEKLSSEGVLLQNENGKLVITKETLESLVNGVAKGFESTQNVVTRIYLDKESNILVNVILYVLPTAIIKELSTNMQTRIKEVVKRATDLELKEVNIEIRNIAPVAKVETTLN